MWPRSVPSLKRATGLPAFMGWKRRWPASCWSSPTSVFGLVLNLEEDNVGAVLLGEAEAIKEGDLGQADRAGSRRCRSAMRWSAGS